MQHVWNTFDVTFAWPQLSQLRFFFLHSSAVMPNSNTSHSIYSKQVGYFNKSKNIRHYRSLILLKNNELIFFLMRFYIILWGGG